MLGERDYMRGERRAPWRSWSAVKTLLVINIVVFLLCNLSEHGSLAGDLALNSLAIRDWRVWRLVTYMFTHLNFSHIFWNMWSLWMFGSMIERVLGKRRLIQLYVFSGLIGGALWTLANWSNPFAFCIGASGATFGIMAAAAMAFPNATFVMIFPPIPMKLRTMAIIFLFLEVFQEWQGMDNIAHLAHLGGALGAFIYMHQLRRSAAGGEPSLWTLFTQWLARLLPRNDDTDGAAAKPGPRRLGDLDSDEVDRVLDKLAATGRSSLTPREMEILKEASQRLKDQ